MEEGTMIESVVAGVIALLQARENNSYQVDIPALIKGLPKSVYLHHAQLYLPLADLAFIKSLVEYDVSHAAVATILQAWAYGVRLRLMVHRQLLPALPLRELGRLPVTLVDHLDIPVNIITGENICYANVILLHDCWLCIDKHTFITALARDVIAKQGITLIWRE